MQNVAELNKRYKVGDFVRLADARLPRGSREYDKARPGDKWQVIEVKIRAEGQADVYALANCEQAAKGLSIRSGASQLMPYDFDPELNRYYLMAEALDVDDETYPSDDARSKWLILGRYASLAEARCGRSDWAEQLQRRKDAVFSKVAAVRLSLIHI